MPKEKLQEARDFLEELAETPPCLPYEPSLLPLLFAATREGSNASIDDLTVLIERSQKLATRVLSLANSALYALESTVTSLRRAISILGFREVRTLVIMIGAVSAIKGAKLPKGFDAIALWRHQLKTASVAKVLAGALSSSGGPRSEGPEKRLEMAPDEAYAAGLLHDIGKVFLAASRPQLWEAIEEIRQISSLSFFEAEDEYWGMDHALVGAQVLHYWKLPLLLTDPINWHHAPELAPVFRVEAKLLAAANRMPTAG
jgi:HD-like signal output (HDOD) protein